MIEIPDLAKLRQRNLSAVAIRSQDVAALLDYSEALVGAVRELLGCDYRDWPAIAHRAELLLPKVPA